VIATSCAICVDYLRHANRASYHPQKSPISRTNSPISTTRDPYVNNKRALYHPRRPIYFPYKRHTPPIKEPCTTPSQTNSHWHALLSNPVRGMAVIPRWVATPLAPALGILIQSKLGLVHPPSAAAAVIFMEGEMEVKVRETDK
jgi:hypothetical protein